MTRFKYLPPIAALAALLTSPSSPALAEPCTEPLDLVVAGYTAAGNELTMLNEEEIRAAMDAFNLEDVSRGFYVETEAHIFLGLEVDGCLLPPIEIKQPLKATRLSGATAFGIYA